MQVFLFFCQILVDDWWHGQKMLFTAWDWQNTHMMLPNWIPPFVFPFLSNLGHWTSPCIELCVLSHLACNLWRSPKLDFGKLSLTYPGILWGIWSSIPMFHTCKKTYPSILWAHQIWAWYLKPCQKKVGCQNCRGLPDTLYVNAILIQFYCLIYCTVRKDRITFFYAQEIE